MNATDTNEQKFQYQVHMVLDNLPVSKEKLDEIEQATRNDYVLQKLSSTIVEGWPETKEILPPELHAYFQYQHEITSAEGLLFKGDRVIIPTALQQGNEREASPGSHWNSQDKSPCLSSYVLARS